MKKKKVTKSRKMTLLDFEKALAKKVEALKSTYEYSNLRNNRDSLEAVFIRGQLEAYKQVDEILSGNRIKAPQVTDSHHLLPGRARVRATTAWRPLPKKVL